MRRIVSRLGPVLAALALALTAVAAAPAVLAGDPCFHDMTRPPATTGATTSVAIGDCTFTPTVTYVAIGTLVRLTNASTQAHEVVGANLAWGAHDKLLQPGDSMGWTFERAGVHPYSCMLHPGMTGAIVVGAAAPAERDAGAAPAGPIEAGPPSAEPSAGADPLPAAALGAGIAAALAIAGAGVWLVVRRRAQAPS